MTNVTVQYLSDAVEFSTRCISCSKKETVKVTTEQFRKMQDGTYVQSVLPNLSPDTRELFISGLCGECFDNMFEGDKFEGME